MKKCKRGEYLCPKAEALWAEIGIAHKLKNWSTYWGKRDEYDEHINSCEGHVYKPAHWLVQQLDQSEILDNSS